MSTDWRTLGDMAIGDWVAELERLGSPLLAESAAAHAAARPHTRLALAMSFHETKHGTLFTVTGFDAGFKNPLALMVDGQYTRFPNWAAAFAEWRRRLTDPTYKSGVYARTTTLSELIHEYAPASAGNDEARYLEAVTECLAAFSKETNMTYPRYPVLMDATTGRSIQVECPVPIVQQLIPASKTAQRPGIALRSPWKWVQHETGNPSDGANAEMHYQFLMGLTTENISFHFVVDDHQVIQLIPLNEVTWQAADGDGPGNMAGVSCELCINADGDERLARRNAEWLCGGVLKVNGGTTADVTRHWDYNAADPDRHHCPDHMMNEDYWPVFVANVGTVIAGDGEVIAGDGEAPAVFTNGFPEGMDAGIAGLLFGTLTKDGEVYRFDPDGQVSKLWLAEGARTGVYPALVDVQIFDTRSYFVFRNGLVLWRPNDQEALRVLAA